MGGMVLTMACLMPRLIAVTLLALTLLAAPSGASGATPIRECGNFDGFRWSYEQVRGAGIFNVTTRRVWCTVARRVARRAYNTYERGDRVWRWRGWRCRRIKTGYESADTRCTKRRVHVVRWQAGS